MVDKPLHEMTDAELRADFERWDKRIREATGWGAALAAADGLRKINIGEFRRRGLEPPETEHRGTTTKTAGPVTGVD